jgi:hypothetical protein
MAPILFAHQQVFPVPPAVEEAIGVAFGEALAF